MACKEQVKIYKFVELIVFFCLLGLAAYFMIGVLEHYFSRKSSFTQSEEKITELPTITMCFSSNGAFDGDVEYLYGSDFKILYKYYDIYNNSYTSHEVYLKEGSNIFDKQEMLRLEKLSTRYSGICYKISSTKQSMYKPAVMRVFIWYFKETIPLGGLPYLKLYLTSEKNSYGLTQVIWFDGKVKQAQIESGIYKQINFKPQQTNYLKITTNCKDESYFDCFEKLFMDKIHSSCQHICSPYSLPTVPVCKTDTDFYCAKTVYDHVYASTASDETLCPQSCTILQYSGEESWTGNVSDWYDNASHAFAWVFDPPESVTTYQEYLIYDEVSMIGSIGGTLGMCIGFSLTNLSSSFLNFIQYLHTRLGSHI